MSYWDPIPMAVWILENGSKTLIDIVTVSPVAYFAGKAGGGIARFKRKLLKS
jgi:hypothetical protein